MLISTEDYVSIERYIIKALFENPGLLDSLNDFECLMQEDQKILNVIKENSKLDSEKLYQVIPNYLKHVMDQIRFNEYAYMLILDTIDESKKYIAEKNNVIRMSILLSKAKKLYPKFERMLEESLKNNE